MKHDTVGTSTTTDRNDMIKPTVAGFALLALAGCATSTPQPEVTVTVSAPAENPEPVPTSFAPTEYTGLQYAMDNATPAEHDKWCNLFKNAPDLMWEETKGVLADANQSMNKFQFIYYMTGECDL